MPATGALDASPFRLPNDDELGTIFRRVGDEHAFLLALVCRRFREVMAGRTGAPRRVGRRLVRFQTPRRVAVSSVSIARWARLEAGLDPCLTCALAAAAGRLDVLRWAREDAKAGWDTWAPASAALAGHVHVLEWLRARECPFDWRTPAAAAAAGHLDALRWARERRLPLRRAAIVGAARGGELACVRYLVEACGLRPTKEACSAAARGGHLETLRWLRDAAKAPWDDETMTAAARGGHTAVLEFGAAAGCRLRADTACQHAAWAGHAHAVLWLRARMSASTAQRMRHVLAAADAAVAEGSEAAAAATAEAAAAAAARNAPAAPPPSRAPPPFDSALARTLPATFRWLGGPEPRVWRPYALEFARARAEYYAATC